MMQVFQILTITQGLLLILILFKIRNQFLKPVFWLFIFMLLSVILFLLGDDDNNLFVANKDWFLFDSTLFITFYLLFTKYYTNSNQVFYKRDLLFFVPNFLYFIVESIELIIIEENLLIEAIEFSLSFIFIGYVILIMKILYANSLNKSWNFVFSLFICVLFIFKFGVELYETVSGVNLDEPMGLLNTIFILVIAILTYFITYKILLQELNVFIPLVSKKEYKNSNLTPKKRNDIENLLLKKMEKEERYLEKGLTLQDLADELEIPKQYISEVLNIGINKNFDKFVNEYRVKKYIELYQSGQYEHLTLYSIAQKAGFNSKSSFNSKFKAYTGFTPTQYFKNSTEISIE